MLGTSALSIEVNDAWAGGNFYHVWMIVPAVISIVRVNSFACVSEYGVVTVDYAYNASLQG
jgi:hypothetical protein